MLDALPFEIEADGVGAVTLASDGAGNTAVVYVAGEQLRMRVIKSGGAMTPVIQLAWTVRAIAEPSVAFDGTAFLIAWTEYERNPDHCPFLRCPGPYLWADVHAARVTDRVLQTRTIFAAAGRNDFYYSPRALPAKGGPAIAVRHGEQLLFARVDEELSPAAPRVFAESIYFPDVAVIAGVPLVGWYDDGVIRIVALNDDLTRSASETVFQPGHLWYWGATIVPGPTSGWALYSRSTTDEEEYGLAPRTFARRLDLGPRRGRPLRR